MVAKAETAASCVIEHATLTNAHDHNVRVVLKDRFPAIRAISKLSLHHDRYRLLTDGP